MAAIRCTACLIDLKQGTNEVTEHYKGAWHAYNLKRQIVGMGAIPKDIYDATVEQHLNKKAAAIIESSKKGCAHVKASKQEKHAKKMAAKQAALENPKVESDEESEYEEIEYKPTDSLFDRHQSSTVEENLEYMKTKFGFSLFEPEYICDVKGLLVTLGEKIALGGQCIFCNKGFRSREACWNHMKDMRHMQIGYSNDEIMADLDPFYDYSSSYQKFEDELKIKFADHIAKFKAKKNALEDARAAAKMLALKIKEEENTNEEDDEEEEELDSDWESEVDSDAEESDDEDGDSLKKDISGLLAKYGLQPVRITDDGFLKLMDGREIVARSAARILKQRSANLTGSAGQYSHLQAKRDTHGLRARLALTNGEFGPNQQSYRSKEEIKSVVKYQKYELKKLMQLGWQANKFTRAAPEPQKLMM